jgi:hypothetical protein
MSTMSTPPVVLRVAEYTAIYRKRADLCSKIIALDVLRQRTATLMQAELHLISREKQKLISTYVSCVADQEKSFSIERLSILNRINTDINALDIPDEKLTGLISEHARVSHEMSALQTALMRVVFPPDVILVDSDGQFVCRISTENPA